MIIVVVKGFVVVVLPTKHTCSTGVNVHKPLTDPQCFMMGHRKEWYLFFFGANSGEGELIKTENE